MRWKSIFSQYHWYILSYPSIHSCSLRKVKCNIQFPPSSLLLHQYLAKLYDLQCQCVNNTYPWCCMQIKAPSHHHHRLLWVLAANESSCVFCWFPSDRPQLNGKSFHILITLSVVVVYLYLRRPPPLPQNSSLHLFIHRQSCGVNNNKLGLSKIIPLILSPRCRCCANSAWIPAITPCSNSRPPEPVSQPACTQSRLACEVMKNNVPLLLIPPTRI